MAGSDRGRLITIFPSIWWRHGMEMLSVLPALCDGVGGSTGDRWIASNAKHWVPIQTVELAVIWDTVVFMWCHCYEMVAEIRQLEMYHDIKLHGANMGPTLVLSSPGGPHVGHMNLAIWVAIRSICYTFTTMLWHHDMNHLWYVWYKCCKMIKCCHKIVEICTNYVYI